MNALTDDTPIGNGASESTNSLSLVPSDDGDEASAFLLDHFSRIVRANPVGGIVAYHTRDEGLERHFDTDDTCLKTMDKIKVTATTNLNNLIGVSHLKESS